MSHKDLFRPVLTQITQYAYHKAVAAMICERLLYQSKQIYLSVDGYERSLTCSPEGGSWCNTPLGWDEHMIECHD